MVLLPVKSLTSTSYELALKGYDLLAQKFVHHPDVGKIKLLKFELLMSPEINDHSRASLLLDEVIHGWFCTAGTHTLGHNSGSEKLSKDTMKLFHQILVQVSAFLLMLPVEHSYFPALGIIPCFLD